MEVFGSSEFVVQTGGSFQEFLLVSTIMGDRGSTVIKEVC